MCTHHSSVGMDKCGSSSPSSQMTPVCTKWRKEPTRTKGKLADEKGEKHRATSFRVSREQKTTKEESHIFGGSGSESDKPWAWTGIRDNKTDLKMPE